MEEKAFPFSEQEVISFVQRNADYYLGKWKKLHQTGSKLSWNWAAFLFNTLWLFYRKMYAYGFAVIGLSIVANILTLPFIIQNPDSTASLFATLVSWLFSLGIWFLIGIYGNYLYYKKFVNTYYSLKNQVSDSDVLLEILKYKGGTNWAAAILLLVVLLGLGAILGMIEEVSMK